MNFKDFYLMNESKKDIASYCLMIYPDDESINKLKKIHKLLNIKARENVTPKQYHQTIRYFKTENDITPLIDYLNDFKFNNCNAKGNKLDFLGDSYSLFLKGSQVDSLHNKMNNWIVKNKYPKSDYPSFTQHIAFCYDAHKSWIPPELDEKDYQIDITYNNIKLAKNHETIWKLN
jgi:hypothetical protein